ncbi:LytTR family DNA-binding domain-containing protein [Tropicibacter sp. Alg240-R139]|uniref:LytTR family DNA-binding domain-containing protein n=1 Tax=Tropicibacter sp. Alg240-R139 TaxID=2305991 RepID=UPI0013DE7A78|nr:LytTR family DNA-binding domain-containing protein [Tropicibacter sp. Alg240-R139]
MISKFKKVSSKHNLLVLVPVLVFLTLLAAQAKPFGTEGVSFLGRFTFWSAVMVVGALIAHFSARCIQRYAENHKQIVRDVATVALVTILFTPVLWTLIWLTALPETKDIPNLITMLQYGTIFASGLLVLRRSFPGLEPQSAQEEGQIIQPRLYRRLPEGFEGPVLRLTVHDHSVDVVTIDETITIRSRFADAIDEMEPIIGYCTHRSHWVTRDAIESVERTGGRIYIRLINGDHVPISRKYKPKLEEAGIM